VRSRIAREADRLATGELLLGYPNEVGILPRSPVLSSTGRGRAAFAANGDFGKNGSYLVFRTLEQDVGLFWRTTLGAAGAKTPAARVALASKMVGRWPDGTPLVSVPEGAVQNADREDFDYAHDDPHGLSCPFGAHIRRSNPRATLARDPVTGLQKSKKHRILRRGRTYGEPFTQHLTPEEIIEAADAHAGRSGPRGLHFMCYNADLANQFEFVQQTWINGPIFQGLHGEVDPLVGAPDDTSGLFTIPGDPIRKRVHRLPRFVHVRGGAYFFLPSRAALRYLASLSD
jgi:Dyp-type peroxidase family